MNVWRTKSVEQSIAETEEPEHRLKKNLGALDLTIFGVGVIIGAGIFVYTGLVAATHAGPAIALSFLIAGLACALAAAHANERMRRRAGGKSETEHEAGGQDRSAAHGSNTASQLRPPSALRYTRAGSVRSDQHSTLISRSAVAMSVISLTTFDTASPRSAARSADPSRCGIPSGMPRHRQ